MEIRDNVSLQPFNTFGLESTAKHFAACSSADQMREAIADQRFTKENAFILGGGSNILLTKNFDGFVLKNEIKGIDVVREDEAFIYVKAGGGENWHQFVLHCIEQGWAGIENLSLIPGCVGASPMQNIGAYGVEIKDVFETLEALHIESGEIQHFNLNDCEFGYRESVFKRALKGQHIILNVTYRLRKQPQFNTSYGPVEKELERLGVETLSIGAVSQAIINIRQSKLPDPAEIGNSGSFFKNPVIPNSLFEKVKSNHPNVAAYPAGPAHTKIAAGWLIEHAGWKGKTLGNYGVHKKQALVLVNYGGAKGRDIYRLSEDILQSVKDKFGVQLEREVNIL